jgi:hypothetical protein
MACAGQTDDTVRPVDSAGQAGDYNRCTETFQEASVTPLGPRTKITSKHKPDGKKILHTT